MLIAVLLIGLMAFGAIGIWLLVATDRAQKKAESNAPQILDESFDGKPDVTFTVNMRTVKYATVIAGAKERGYKLAHQTGGQYGTLTFEKV